MKELWKAVKQLTGREHEPAADPGITADSLNRHYASMSIPTPATSSRR